jgi:hypothetical protein
MASMPMASSCPAKRSIANIALPHMQHMQAHASTCHRPRLSKRALLPALLPGDALPTVDTGRRAAPGAPRRSATCAPPRAARTAGAGAAARGRRSQPCA